MYKAFCHEMLHFTHVPFSMTGWGFSSFSHLIRCFTAIDEEKKNDLCHSDEA